jgi:hypothetical protein
MTGRAEVARLEKQLDAAFQRIKSLGPAADIEVQSDFARYLCVLVSGYLEKSVAELMLEHARNNGAATLQRFVDYRTRQFANPNSQRLADLVGSFHPDWRRGLEAFLVDDVKDAVDSVVNLRNTIAHGGTVGVTYQRVLGYYERVKRVVAHVAMLCGA